MLICHSMYVVVKGQLETDFLLPPCWVKGPNSGLRLGGERFCLVNHIAGPALRFELCISLFATMLY